MNPGQEVLDAWAEAYGLLATIFINREEEIYQQTEQEIGGWRGTREFKVIDKKKKVMSLPVSYSNLSMDNQS